MTSENLDYLKAVETIENSYPPAKGFVSETLVQQTGDKIIISQNNLIIELLLRTNQKLDQLISGTPKVQTNYSEILDKINSNLKDLQLQGKKTVNPPTQQLVVWKDPRSLFPPK